MAQTNPVMGFSTWYAFRTAISESLVLQQAQLLVSSGLADAGYNYVNLDDGWMSPSRTSGGFLQADPAKFPNGIAALADEIHALGLKFGIYTAIGNRTCQNLPGSWSHYARDAKTFADWGVDFVKVDSCGGLRGDADQETVTEDFRLFGYALRDFNPDVVYSQELPIYALGQPGFTLAVQNSAGFANMWRVCADEYPLSHANAYPALQTALAADLHLHSFAGPGHWNDLDMVAPGYPGSGWTLQDLQNQLGVWALEASPLIISADLRTLPVSALAALKNPHMIAIDQSGEQCPTSVTVGHIQALIKPDPEGGVAVCFVNMGTGTASAQFTLAQLGIQASSASGYNVWANTTSTFGGVSITLAASTTRLFRIQGI